MSEATATEIENDDAIETDTQNEEAASSEEPRTNQATMLLEIFFSGDPKLFRTPNGRAFVLSEGRYYECPSDEFARYLRALWLNAKEMVSSSDITKPVMASLESIILHDPEIEEREVFVRIGFDDAERVVYYDLCQHGNQRAIKVSAAHGVQIVDEPPVIFLRPAGQLPAEDPVLDPAECRRALKEFLQLTRLTGESSTLLLAWLLSCFSPARERLLLNVYSEAGSGKTELAQAVRQQIDPSTHSESTKFDNDDDLCAAASNQGVLFMGNLSGIHQKLSNLLCLLLTGGTFQSRSLYTNGGLYAANLLMPVILTSLSNPIWAADLGSRTLSVESPPIDPAARLGTDELRRKFEALRPRVLGALCLAAAHALANPTPRAIEHRMQASIDFVASGIQKLGVTVDDLRAALGSSKASMTETHLDASPIWEPLRAYADESLRLDKDAFRISSSDLLEQLRRLNMGSQKMFPDRANQLSTRLTEILEPLRSVGIHAERVRTSTFRGWYLDFSKYEQSQCGHRGDQLDLQHDARVVELEKARDRRDRKVAKLGLRSPLFEGGDR